jgi:uncharacterized protein
MRGIPILVPDRVHAQGRKREKPSGITVLQKMMQKMKDRNTFFIRQPVCFPLVFHVMRQILGEFLRYHGVTSAALVGRDGFVIEAAAAGPFDVSAIGAFASEAMNFFSKAGGSLESGKVRHVMLEYRDGAMILAPVTAEEFLVIQTNTTQNLGRLTYLIDGHGTRIAAAM